MAITKTRASKVDLKERTAQSKYQEIVDEALKLKKGQAILCPVPKGVKDTIYRNRLSVVMYRKVKPEIETESLVVRLRCTANNEVMISLEEVEETE